MGDTPKPGGARPRKVSVQLPHASAEDFLQKYAACLTLGGVYLRVAPQPVGSEVELEVRVRSGERVLFGLGVVSFVTGQGGQGHPGMGVRFVQLDDASRQLVQRACSGRAGADAPLPPLPAGVGAAQGEWAPQPATIFSAHAQPAAAAQPAPAKAPAHAPAHVECPLDKVLPVTGRPTGPVIGIDLGTTFTCVACVKGGRPYVIPSREGHNTIPSIIALNQRNKLVVGHPAKNVQLTSPRQAVFGAKRLVGRPFHSPVVQAVKERFQYEIVEGPRGEAAVRLGGQAWSLQQLSALILLEAREIAEAHLGCKVQRAVITVPAYYSDSQRQAVRAAGELAGLYVERILNEPTAAALAFGAGKQLEKRVLVYDLGGGTFDVSILQLSGNVYEVVSTGGDTFLGGVDFDVQIVDWMLQELERASGGELPADQTALQRLVDAAEKAKRELSEKEQARVLVPFIAEVKGKPFDLDVVLTREQLNQFCDRLVDRTLRVCGEVLRARRIHAREIDEILLVGGMSRMPLVHAKIEKAFGKAPHKGVHPDEAVALGAALYGHSIEQVDGVVLIDVLPMSIGIGLPGGRLKHIVERNTPLPHAKVYGLATTRDDQPELELMIFQGDGDRVEQAEYLGTLDIAPLPKGPKGSVEIEVQFTLSAECLLTVSAKILATGREVKATLSTRDTPEAVKAKLARALHAESRAQAARDPSRASATGLPAVGRNTATGLPPVGRGTASGLPAVGSQTASGLPAVTATGLPAVEAQPSWFSRLLRKLAPGRKAQ